MSPPSIVIMEEENDVVPKINEEPDVTNNNVMQEKTLNEIINEKLN